MSCRSRAVLSAVVSTALLSVTLAGSAGADPSHGDDHPNPDTGCTSDYSYCESEDCSVAGNVYPWCSTLTDERDYGDGRW